MDAFTVLAVENLTKPQRQALEILARWGDWQDRGVWIYSRTRENVEFPDATCVNLRAFAALECLGLAYVTNPGWIPRNGKLTVLGHEAVAHLGMVTA